jgi:flagellar P-ring protein FlgI
MKQILFGFLLASAWQRPAEAARVKDVAAWEGVRENQLFGYGLVIGLNGTGDKRQTVFSAQSLANALEKLGVSVNASAIQVRNTASVIVTANLPAHAQPGLRMDVQVAVIGDASNLQGGILLLTPLKGADGQIYAAAQGSVVTGGFVAGRGGNTQSVNHPTAGRIPNGAIIEKPAPSVSPGPVMHLQLKNPDSQTATRIVDAINFRFSAGGPLVARASHSGMVEVAMPSRYALRPVQFVAEVEGLSVETDSGSKIIINERTGTVVLGKEVMIAPVAILHGALSVEIQTDYDVSQPAPLSGGQTTVVPRTGVQAKEERAKNVMLKQGATVEDLVKALNAIGSTPRDIIAILQSLKSAGALTADLEVI